MDTSATDSPQKTIYIWVSNSGERPVQVGSHFHFAEVNPALVFDREKAQGMRLNIPSGTVIRFEPGKSRRIELVALNDARWAQGFRGAVKKALDEA